MIELQTSLARLCQGAADPGSPWRNLALGTVGLDGAPQVRTVVLRHADPTARVLEVHTDTRSAKHAELCRTPAATLHGWDGGERVQLRVSGTVRLHGGDDVAQAAWSALHGGSRATYAVRPGPGSVLDNPHADADAAAAFGVFCVVRLTWHTMEYLRLGQDSHQRARFTWAGDTFAATWLVP